MFINGFGTIVNFQMKKQICTHSICIFEIIYEGQEMQAFIQNNIGKKVCIEDDDRILMVGIIESIKGRIDYLKQIISITVVSLSKELDIEKRNRIFQSTKKSYKDIMDILSQNNPNFRIRMDRNYANERQDDFVVQYQETDFEFFCRIAKEQGLSVFITDTNRRETEIYLGTSKEEAVKNIYQEDLIAFEIETDGQEITVQIQTNAWYEVGEKLSIYGKNYLIVKAEMISKDNNIVYRYLLLKENKEEKKEKCLETVMLCKGKVLNNCDPEHLGRLQVEFLDIKDIMPGERQWIPYLTSLSEKNGGIVLIPEVNEIVEIMIGKKECIAFGCNREREIITEDQDINTRTFRFYDNIMKFQKNAIEIFSKDARILLDEDKLQLQKGQKKIELSADNINLDCGNEELRINAKKVKVKTQEFAIG